MSEKSFFFKVIIGMAIWVLIIIVAAVVFYFKPPSTLSPEDKEQTKQESSTTSPNNKAEPTSSAQDSDQQQLDTYLSSIGMPGVAFGLLANSISDEKWLFSSIFILPVIILLFLGFIFILNKLNEKWGNIPSKIEISLEIIGLLGLFYLGYTAIKLILEGVITKDISVGLSLIGFILHFVIFIILIKKLYQTDYLTSVKITLVSEISAFVITGVVGILYLVALIFYFLIFGFSIM